MTRVRTVEINVPMTTYDYDDDSVVVVIGSGAGGGTMADELSSQGVSVVVLEAGPRFKELDFTLNLQKHTTKYQWYETQYVKLKGDYQQGLQFLISGGIPQQQQGR